MVHLPEELDHLLLSGGVIRIVVNRFPPHVFHRPARVETRNEVLGGRPQAKELVAEGFVEHVSVLAAKKLASDADARSQGDMLRRDKIPRFVEEVPLRL